MAQYNDCGHNKEWTLRLVDKGRKFEYCIGCIVDKIGIKDIREPNLAKSVAKEVKKDVVEKTKK